MSPWTLRSIAADSNTGLDDPISPPDLELPQSPFQAFRNRSKSTICNCYLRHLMFHSFFSALLQNRIIIFLRSFISILWFPGMVKSTKCRLFSNRFIWPIYTTLTGDTTSGQSEPGNNANNGSTCLSQDFQNWSLIIKWSLVSCPGYRPFREKGLTPLHGIQSAYSNLYLHNRAEKCFQDFVYVISNRKVDLPFKNEES